jgi:tRNA-(ms[2]io[6]A)-hydroxylase
MVLNDFNHFLADHASCERKAHAAAMMLVNRFPEYPDLQDIMIGLAREELEHFQQVVGLLRERKIPLGPDEVDTYVKRLLTHVRHPREEHILDRLMVVAMVEARSCERFCMIADALPAGPLKIFYTEFARAEGTHFPLVLHAAKLLFPEGTVNKRLDEWLAIESDIARDVPYRAAVH